MKRILHHLCGYLCQIPLNIHILHRHMFSGITSLDYGHVHEYVGLTDPAPTGVPHVHRYHTVTSMNDGHTHIIEGATGPAINLPNGGHVHYLEGFTTINGMHPHTHHYNGTTGNEVD